MDRPRDSRGRFLPYSSNRKSPSKRLTKPGRRSSHRSFKHVSDVVDLYGVQPVYGSRPQDMYESDAYEMKHGKVYPKGLPPATSRRSPSKHASPPSSVSCTRWAGCVYSSMAADARAKGMKLAHGVDDMHKLLHTAKREYPQVYEQLYSNPNAWMKNSELYSRVVALYVPAVGRRHKY